MTTIHQLPKEIVPEILRNLQSHQLTEVQRVCRAWYLPAHLLLLRNISLRSEYQIEKFIQSIDHNMDASYLTAVQEIEIGSDDGFVVEYQFDNETMEKLFYRFPNLRRISIDSNSSCFNEFSEDTCQTLSRKCQKLYQFEVYLDDEADDDEVIYCRTMHKLRSLVTAINLEKAGSALEFGGIVRFITSFPRLQRVWGHHHHLSKFDYCFPIFERLAYLRDFCFNQDFHDNVEDDFAERYLARLSEEKRDLITQRVSQVTRLAYSGDRVLCPNTFKFIAKYFTGLEDLYIGCYRNARRWTDYHQEVLLSHLTSLSVKKNCDILLGNMRILAVAECLPVIENKLLSQVPSNRALLVVTQTKHTDKNMIDLRLQWPTTTQITISFAKDMEPRDTLETLLKNSQLDNIDQLLFHIREKISYTKTIDINSYNTLFKSLPILKQATLDIPPSFLDYRPCAEIRQYTSMESLTLRGASRVLMKSILDSFALMFPNLKQLHLYYYDGLNVPSMKNHYIRLSNYSLERLVLDMTPFPQAMKEKKIMSDFFVVEIDSQERKEQYRISTDLSSVTKIECDRCKFEHDGCQGSLRVHIIVNSLQRLEGYMCSYYSNTQEYLNVNVLDPYLKHVVIF